MYFALIINRLGNPYPVTTGEDNEDMATWETLEEAIQETKAMAISASREILIFDLDDSAN